MTAGGLDEATMIVARPDGDLDAAVDPSWFGARANGGYLAAIALRSLMRDDDPLRILNLTCQFMKMPAAGPVVLRVGEPSRGLTTELRSVRIEQAGRTVLTAQAWLGREMGGPSLAPMRAPTVVSHEDVQPLGDLVGGDVGPIGRHIELRPVDWDSAAPAVPNERFRCWARIRSGTAAPPAVQMGTLAVVADSILWPAVMDRLDDSEAASAVTVTLTLGFHRWDPVTRWLLGACQVAHLGQGSLSGSGQIWDSDGNLLASSQVAMLCRTSRRRHDRQASLKKAGTR